MNLAIEYNLRSGNLKENLKFPVSIFLKHFDGKKQLALVIEKNYKNKDVLSVKHWHLSDCSKDEVLPRCSSYQVDKSELFHSDKIVIPEFLIMPYVEAVLPHGGSQTSDPPMCHTQEKQYKQCIEHFFFTIKHYNEREKILWRIFKNIYMPIDQKQNKRSAYLPSSSQFPLKSSSIDNSSNRQARALKNTNPILFNKWFLWKKHILLPKQSVAGELIFLNSYKENEKSYKKLQKTDNNINILLDLLSI